MNENNNNNVVSPYKAKGNLNTIIENPSISVKDTMNINIQSMDTINNQNFDYQSSITNNQNSSKQISSTASSIINDNYKSDFQNKNFVNINTNATYSNIPYVTSGNKGQKKKNIKSSSAGGELITALLIIIVLLVFILVFLK